MSGGTPTRVRVRARAWAELLRVSALFTVPGDALAGAAAAGVRPGRRTGLAVGASLCLYEAGMALNDWADREEDAAERPERPIPSGRIRPGAALAAAGGLTAAGLVLAACAGRRAAVVAGGLAGTVWAYDLGLKHTKAGPAAMAAARSLDLLLGAAASSPVGIRPALPSALVLGGHTYAVTAVSRRETQGGAPLTALAALCSTLALAGLTGLTARRRTGASAGLNRPRLAGPTGSAGAARAVLAGLAGAGLSALADAGPWAGPNPPRDADRWAGGPSAPARVGGAARRLAAAAADRPGAGGRARVLGEAALAGLWALTGPAAAARPGPGDAIASADAGLNMPRYAAVDCAAAAGLPPRQSAGTGTGTGRRVPPGPGPATPPAGLRGASAVDRFRAGDGSAGLRAAGAGSRPDRAPAAGPGSRLSEVPGLGPGSGPDRASAAGRAAGAGSARLSGVPGLGPGGLSVVSAMARLRAAGPGSGSDRAPVAVRAAGAGSRLSEVAGLGLAGVWAASAVDRFRAGSPALQALAGAGLAGLYAGTAGRPLAHAVLNPSPPLTQRAVGGGIRAMIPLQAALAARAGAPGTALALVGLVPVARRLARKVNPT